MKEKQDVDGLITFHGHKDSSFRERAAEALGKIGDTRAVKQLIQSFKEDSFDARIGAVEAVEKIGDLVT